MSPMKKKLGSLDVMQMVSFVRSFRGGGVVIVEEGPAPAAPDEEKPHGRDPDSRASAAAPSLSQPLARRPDPPPPARSNEAAGLYRRLCTSCHGRDGRGSELRSAMPTLPDFSSHRWQTARNDAQITASILDGQGALMPSWRGRLTADQARELAVFVRTLNPSGVAAGGATPSDFRRRFQALQEQWEELDRQAKALDGSTNAAGP
jgi:mono/diheme cytochrome c family protein